MRKLATLLLATLACTAVVPVSASAQGLPETLQKAGITGPLNPSLYAGQCNYGNIPGIVWWGTDTEMRVQRIASLAAPTYWFSPDGPLLRAPAQLPFEDSASIPVVYYQLDEIVTMKDSVGEFTLNPDDKGQSIVSFKNTGLLRMGYFAYYTSEAEQGAHEHDLEAAALKIAIMRSDGTVLPALTEARCDERNYLLVLIRVVGIERRRGTEDWETEKRLGDPRRDLVGSAVYELRPLPPSDLGAYDEHLHRLLKSKGVVDWPKETEKSDLQGFLDWAEENGQ
jgi:hypothetical protein